MFRPSHSIVRFCVVFRLIMWWAAFCLCVPVLHADEIRIQFAMLSDPSLDLPTATWKLPEGTVPLWRQALARPETEYQVRAAEAVVRAHEEGLDEVDALEPDVLRVLKAESTSVAARYAAARAAIALNARQASESLLIVSQVYGGEFQPLIEPVLASWDYEPAREVWMERLMNRNTQRRGLIVSADCLGRVRVRDAVARLVELASAREESPDVRLAAARDAGAIADSGLDFYGKTLGATTSIVDRLCAVGLLTRHTSTAAQQTLLKLAVDAEPSVAAGALKVLLSIDPELVLPLVPQSLESGDANVRWRAADALIALPTPERVSVLSNLLNDPHPGLRSAVREALFADAQRPELDSAVRESAMQVLNGDDWRGQEQAAMLLAALDHKPAAPRMAELLKSQRPEVMIAIGWGLRTLAVPETAPAILEAAEQQTKGPRDPAIGFHVYETRIAHLFEALGLMHYRPAEPLMRQYIPKSEMHNDESRGAAIWALGHLYAGEANEDLATLFMERATDTSAEPVEYEFVQAMSLVSIARMQAVSQLDKMRELIGPVTDHSKFDYSIRWAIQQMTGEDIPLAPPVVLIRRGWFLEPLGD